MKNELFNELLKSMHEMDRIVQGELAAFFTKVNIGGEYLKTTESSTEVSSVLKAREQALADNTDDLHRQRQANTAPE